MPIKTTKKAGSVAAVGLASAMALSVCLTAPVAAQSRTSSAKSDVTINVAIAYPAPAKSLLAAFTAKTGIKVNYSYIQWDNLQTKIVAAAEAHTYFADVADVDWSKVGEYYQTKWFLPLNKYFNPSALYSQYPQLASFVRNGKLLGHAQRRLAPGHDRQHEGLRQSRDHDDAHHAGRSTPLTSTRSRRRESCSTRSTSRLLPQRASRLIGTS